MVVGHGKEDKVGKVAVFLILADGYGEVVADKRYFLIHFDEILLVDGMRQRYLNVKVA